MKSNLLKSLLIAGLASCGVIGAKAEPTPKIAVVDLAKVFDQYWQTAETGNKIQNDKNNAQLAAQDIDKQRNELIAKYNAIITDTQKNVALTPDAKDKANQQLADLRTQIDNKLRELQKLSDDTGNTLRTEFANYKDIALKEINAVAKRICISHGDNLLVDISPNSAYGTTTILYVDPGYTDITSDVLNDLNRDHPKAVPAPTAPAMPAESHK